MLDLGTAQRLGQNLPLPGRIDIEGWVVLGVPVQQQKPVALPQAGKFARHRPAIRPFGKKTVEKVPDILTPRLHQPAFTFFEKANPLFQIAGVGLNRETG